MQILDVIILGVLQGFTEFLPVSSSGHLVLGQYFLHVKSPGNTLEILFHLGTLGSVIFVFFPEIISIIINIKKKSTQKLLIHIFLATMPAVIIGFMLRNKIEVLFESVNSVGFALLFTGLVLILSSNFKNKNSKHSISSSIVIGFGQALAIIPGISRSGMTITISLLFGFSPRESAKFSFLLSIPVIAGAGFLGIQDIQYSETFSIDIIIAAILSSFVVGIIALRILLKLLELGKFYTFGIYCICLGMVSIFI
tara:strand:+ start:13069 stop:13827 length:759 start_codon:yes stop_codon:yes gene_type:complete